MKNPFGRFVLSCIGSAALFVTALMLFTITLPVTQQPANAQSANDPRTPTFRSVTIQPSKSSPGTGEFIVYDKFSTQYLRIDPTNLAIAMKISGTNYLGTNFLSQKFLSGTGVTNTMLFINGILVSVQ